MKQNENGTAISIIGGTDGSTSIFMAGKLGGDTVVAYKTITMDGAKEMFAGEQMSLQKAIYRVQ